MFCKRFEKLRKSCYFARKTIKNENNDYFARNTITTEKNRKMMTIPHKKTEKKKLGRDEYILKIPLLQ
jgi:hypothetical protein